MVDPDFLYTVAQVGVTYAGFSTLVTVVAYRSDMKAMPARIYYMLLLSIIVIASAFLPTILSAYLNKVNTVVVHPGAIILLLTGTLGIWGKFTDAVYVTALFIMLYMSAYLFLQIIVDLLDTEPGS